MRVLEVGELSCKIGETARENWDLMDQAKKHHWFFHLTDFPSPYVVLECDKQGPNAHFKERCAQLCVQHSKQKGSKKVKVDATPCGNVRIDKKDEVGECDYKNEGKVEVIIADGGKREDGEEAGSAAQASAQGADAGKGRGRGRNKSAPTAKEEVPAEPPPVVSGERVSVQKSPKGGWATLSFETAAVRDTLLREHQEIVVQGGVTVKLQPQVDPQTKEAVPTQIFASWGRQAEAKSPVSEKELLRCFEALVVRATAAIKEAEPAQAAGEHLHVRKAAAGGCAVISLQDASIRDAILALGREVIATPPGVTVKLQPQRDPKTKEEVPTDIFAAWGRKVEEATPVSEVALLQCFEQLYWLAKKMQHNKGAKAPAKLQLAGDCEEGE